MGLVHEEPAREAWGLFFQLMMKNRARFAAVNDELQLGPIHGHLLHTLDEQGPLSMSDVADRLVCDPSYVTAIVDRLEARGLVERQPHERDRRVKLLAVTPEGRDLHKRFHELMSEPPAQLTALSAADQKALRDILRRALAR
jgi:DNA-binding MarR family transcriptional regulator